jgi:hypothetical protein
MLTSSVPASPKGFFDGFTYWLLVICAGITLLDWLMGSTRRKRLRDKVFDWWFYVESSSVGSFISLQAESLLKNRLKSAEGMFVLSYGLGTIAVWAGFLSCMHIFHANVTLKDTEVGLSPHVFVAPVLLGLIALFAGSKLQTCLLKRLSRTATGLSVAFACGATFVYICAVFVMILMSAILANFYEFSVRPFYQHHIVRIPEAQFTFHTSISGATWSMAGDKVVTIIALSWTSGLCLASVLSLVLPQIGFSFSKLFSVVLKPSVSLILERFYESKQGVLTTLALAGGALSKMIEETLKYFRA